MARMTKSRFPLWTLFAIVAVAAISIALLMRANELTVFVVLNVLILVFMATTVSGLVLAGRKRAFCLAFSVCGVAYALLVATMPGSELLATESLLNMLANRMGAFDNRFPPTLPPLAGTAVNAQWQPVGPTGSSQATQTIFLQTAAPPPVFNPAKFPTSPTSIQLAVANVRNSGVNYFAFMKTGHCLFALIFGMLGGCFATFLYSRSGRQSADQVGEFVGEAESESVDDHVFA